MIGSCIPISAENKMIDLSLLREGDIIFHESVSEQSAAIKLATHSKYTHVAIIFKYNDQFQVLEAVQPVRISSLDAFIRRGVGGHFVVKRISDYDTVMTPDVIQKMKNLGRSYIGKNYDIYFEWSDSRLYCTELVWKLYKRVTGKEVGKLERLKDFDLENEYVKKLMKKRYGKKIPYNELVISPESMFESENLITVTDR
jgi:hypothetical protein